MTRAFIQRHKTKLVTPAATAAEGLALLGYEVVWFDEEEADRLNVTKDTLVVGFIEVVRNAVQRITGAKPPVLNYPDELKLFLYRNLWTTTVGYVRNHPETWPVFMKPADDIKSFGGRVVRGVRDLVATNGLSNDTPVFASEPVTFKSEYRCFIRHGEVLGCRQYKGDPLIFPKDYIIREMVLSWKTAPAAYCLDVGVMKWERDGGDDVTTLIEVNDAYSAGTYGLDPLMYARFLEARWCEMTGASPIP
jgi:hypothetical protein